MTLMPAVLGSTSQMMLGAIAVWQLEQNPNSSIQVVPTVTLMAVILGSVSLGMLINRVSQLERRVAHLERVEERRTP
jgi:hypothetical protein